MGLFKTQAQKEAKRQEKEFAKQQRIDRKENIKVNNSSKRDVLGVFDTQDLPQIEVTQVKNKINANKIIRVGENRIQFNIGNKANFAYDIEKIKIEEVVTTKHKVSKKGFVAGALIAGTAGAIVGGSAGTSTTNTVYEITFVKVGGGTIHTGGLGQFGMTVSIKGTQLDEFLSVVDGIQTV